MKYVKEYLNEKFTDESEPIKDMGIGYKESFEFSVENKNYIDIAQLELAKLRRKLRTKKSKELRKKLVGKNIVGRFVKTHIYQDANRKFKIKKIKIVFSTGYDKLDTIHYMYVYSDAGISYEILRNQNYTLTM